MTPRALIFCPKCGQSVIAELFHDTNCPACGVRLDVQCDQSLLTKEYDNEYVIYVLDKPVLVNSQGDVIQ